MDNKPEIRTDPKIRLNWSTGRHRQRRARCIIRSPRRRGE